MLMKIGKIPSPGGDALGNSRWDERTVKLIGTEANDKIKKSHVAVFGVGGVGGFAVEALCRAGISTLTIVDGDIITESNLNRQIIATHETLGRLKVEVMKERILSINPEAVVYPHHCFLLPGKMMEQFDFAQYDYIIDAVDTVTLKIGLVVQAVASGTPIISSMGTGNKLDPGRLKVADIYETSVCPLAKVMRKELRARGIERLEVVYSDEVPHINLGEMSIGTDIPDRSPDAPRIPGSISFVPSVAGLLLTAAVINKIIQ